MGITILSFFHAFMTVHAHLDTLIHMFLLFIQSLLSLNSLPSDTRKSELGSVGNL